MSLCPNVTMEIHLDKMCRVCLKQGDNFKSIFYSEDFTSQQISLSAKIMACSSVQVAAGDGLPELICIDCLAQVDVAYDFREKCQNADTTLKKYISLVKPYLSFTETPTQNETVKNKTIANGHILFESNSTSKSGEPNALTDVKSSPLRNQKKKIKDNNFNKVRKQKSNTRNPKEEKGVSDCEKRKKNKEEKDVKCPICKKTFAYLCILKDHMVQHTGAKPYLCSVCGKSFGHTASLTNHMKTHYSDKPHKCDRCELSFHRRAHLVLHMRTHTGEKPFVCDVCGRDFAQSSYLKEHMRVHSGEKPFVCDICGHGFARKSCLVMHRRVHTGELPYACPECGRAFSQRSQRKRHVKRNHKGSACLKATGELILKDLDQKNKSMKQEEIKTENSINENSINNSLNLPQEHELIQRDEVISLPQYESTSNANSPMIMYQSENLSSIYPTTVMPLPLIQIHTALLQ